MELEDVDLRAGHEADGEGAGAGALADEALVAGGCVCDVSDDVFASDRVFSEEDEFEISRKMDLASVKMPGEHVIKGKSRSV